MILVITIVVAASIMPLIARPVMAQQDNPMPSHVYALTDIMTFHNNQIVHNAVHNVLFVLKVQQTAQNVFHLQQEIKVHQPVPVFLVIMM